MSRPAKRTVPAITGSSPDIARSSVVLPAPFGPSSATTSPAAIVDVDAVQHADLAVAGSQALHLQAAVQPPR